MPSTNAEKCGQTQDTDPRTLANRLGPGVKTQSQWLRFVVTHSGNDAVWALVIQKVSSSVFSEKVRVRKCIFHRANFFYAAVWQCVYDPDSLRETDPNHMDVSLA
jgi:hypothetical protein